MDSTRKGMILSTVVHVAFFGVLLLIILLENLRSEPEPIILTLENPPSDAPQLQNTTQPAPAMPDVAPPKLPPVKKIEFPDIPDPQPDTPPPEPTPPPPPPTPTPPKPKPDTPKPKPDPAPEPPKQKTMSIEDFKKQHKIPEKTTTTKTVKPAPKSAPQLNVKDIEDSLQDIIDSIPASSAPSQAEMDALRAYVARLRSQIEIAWIKPELANAGDEWVEIVVTVLPNGKINGYKILKKNGSQAFLSSVDRAIANTRSIGPTPSGRTLPVRFTLRLREE